LDEVDKNLDPVYPTTVLGQLALVIAEIETRPTLNAHEFINNELEFDLNSSYIAIAEKIIGMLDERDVAVADNESIKKS
jgi:hypothetical protein